MPTGAIVEERAALVRRASTKDFQKRLWDFDGSFTGSVSISVYRYGKVMKSPHIFDRFLDLSK